MHFYSDYAMFVVYLLQPLGAGIKTDPKRYNKVNVKVEWV